MLVLSVGEVDLELVGFRGSNLSPRAAKNIDARGHAVDVRLAKQQRAHQCLEGGDGVMLRCGSGSETILPQPMYM